MADEIAPVAPVAAPVAAPTQVPAASSPAVTAPNTPPVPVAETAPQSAPTPAAPAAPSLDAAKPADPKPADAKPSEPATSLISDAVKDKPAPAEAAPASPEQPSAEAAPTYQPFTLPEGVSLGDKELGQFTEILGKNKASQELGQELVDLYLGEMQRLQSHQHEVFNRTREGWRNEFFADREFGGNRRETTLQTCASMIERFGGDAKQIAELRSVFNFTGAGDHPTVIRLLANIGKALSEPAPIAATKPPPVQTSKAARRYGNSGVTNNG